MPRGRDRMILHVDLDAFYASVEQAEDPSLRDAPLIVGGDESSRHGIVLTASYEAKRRGVKTASTLNEARRICPDAVVVPPRFHLYHRYSRAARAIYYEYTDLVEPFGPDEAWLDVTGSAHLFGGDPVGIAREVVRRVGEELGLSLSVGISWNKVFAKFGSDYDKPHGLTVVSRENYRQVVWPAPVRDLIFVGPATARRLERVGITTIGRLAAASEASLSQMLGRTGVMLRDYALGLDDSPVRPFDPERADVDRTAKSIGNGTTLARDVSDEGTARQVVWSLGESVAQRLREVGMLAGSVAVSARDAADLSTRSRQTTLRRATDITGEICHAACDLLLSGWDLERRPVRFIEVRVGSLSERPAWTQLDLWGEERERGRMEELDSAIDGLRRRFGNHAVRRGVEISDPKLASLDPKRDHSTHPTSQI